MRKDIALALRVLSTALTAVLLLAAWRQHGDFWESMLLGFACGLAISLLVVVWQKWPITGEGSAAST